MINFSIVLMTYMVFRFFQGPKQLVFKLVVHRTMQGFPNLAKLLKGEARRPQNRLSTAFKAAWCCSAAQPPCGSISWLVTAEAGGKVLEQALLHTQFESPLPQIAQQKLISVIFY